jgi:hypothetical protein
MQGNLPETIPSVWRRVKSAKAKVKVKSPTLPKNGRMGHPKFDFHIGASELRRKVRAGVHCVT